MTARQTRVLVVEDSLTVRRRIVEAISAAPELVVVGEAEDGLRGIDLCHALHPDVVTMDLMMPVVTGLAATEHIMAHCPTPIVVLSAAVNRQEAFSTFDALAAGAVDALDKPGAGDSPTAWDERLCAAVKMAARIRVIRHPRARLASAAEMRSREAPTRLVDDGIRLPRTEAERPRRASCSKRLVAIGGSTGAPGAVARILRCLPWDYPLPLFVVIHIGPLFSASLSEWLDAQCSMPVRLAVDGELIPRLGAAVVLMPPADRHLLVEGGRVRLRGGPERHFCRPSVDVLFESVAHEIGARTVACLLTGMGNDGAAGLLAIRRAGGDTLAQDEETSAIYGMPQAAIRLGAAARVLPIERIAPALIAAGRAEERAER